MDEQQGYNLPFPKQLRKLLETSGTNQQVLADHVGVSRQTIAQWKDGKTVPNIYSLQKMTSFFQVSYEYLLGETVCPTCQNAPPA